MKKQALNLNPLDGWQKLRENPLTGTAMSIGSFVPGVGGVIGAGDMLNNLYRGNLATAGLNAVQAAAGFVPGGRLVTGLAEKGRLGSAAAKALPYIAPMAAEAPPTMLHHIGSVVPAMAAHGIDQARAMNRPAYQKQLKDQEQIMREFEEWRKHKQTLQGLNAQQPQVKEGKAAPSSSEMAQNLWSGLYGAAPYVAPAIYAGHMMPSYLKDDVSGLTRGAATGTGAAVGLSGGFMGGGLIGSALAQMLAKKYGLDPNMAANVGAGVGGTLGGLAGHWAGRRVTEHMLDNDDHPMNLRRTLAKYSSVMLKSAGRKGESAHRESQFDEARKRIAAQGGNPVSGQMPLSKKQLEQAMKRRGGGKAPTPKAEAPPAVVDPAAASLAAAAPAAPPPIAGKPTVDLGSFKRRAEGGQSWIQRLQSGKTDASHFGGPGMGLPGPETFAAPLRGPMDYLRQAQNHPIYRNVTRFATSPAGIAAGVGAMGLAGTGAYLMGRSKRKAEDDAATKEMAGVK